MKTVFDIAPKLVNMKSFVFIETVDATAIDVILDLRNVLQMANIQVNCILNCDELTIDDIDSFNHEKDEVIIIGSYNPTVLFENGKRLLYIHLMTSLLTCNKSVFLLGQSKNVDGALLNKCIRL